MSEHKHLTFFSSLTNFIPFGAQSKNFPYLPLKLLFTMFHVKHTPKLFPPTPHHHFHQCHHKYPAPPPYPNHIRCFTWSNLFLVKHFDLSLNWHRRTSHLLSIFLPNVSRGTLILSASPSLHFVINAPPPDQYHHSTTYEKQYCSTWNIVEISVTCNVIFHVKHINRHADLMLFSL